MLTGLLIGLATGCVLGLLVGLSSARPVDRSSHHPRPGSRPKRPHRRRRGARRHRRRGATPATGNSPGSRPRRSGELGPVLQLADTRLGRPPGGRGDLSGARRRSPAAAPLVSSSPVRRGRTPPRVEGRGPNGTDRADAATDRSHERLERETALVTAAQSPDRGRWASSRLAGWWMRHARRCDFSEQVTPTGTPDGCAGHGGAPAGRKNVAVDAKVRCRPSSMQRGGRRGVRGPTSPRTAAR